MNEQILQLLISNLGAIISALSTAVILYIKRYFEKRGMNRTHAKEVEILEREIERRKK